MPRHWPAAAALALVVLGACAPVPARTDHDYSFQQEMQSADHWRDLADEISTQVQGVIPGGGYVYVARNGQSAFERGFQGYLETALVQNGYVLNSTKVGGSVIAFDVQTVVHPEHHFKMPFPWIAWLPADIITGAPYPQSSYWRVTHTEAIISVEVTDAAHVMMRKSATYYVPDRDIALYQQPPLACIEPGEAAFAQQQNVALCVVAGGQVFSQGPSGAMTAVTVPMP